MRRPEFDRPRPLSPHSAALLRMQQRQARRNVFLLAALLVLSVCGILVDFFVSYGDQLKWKPEHEADTALRGGHARSLMEVPEEVAQRYGVKINSTLTLEDHLVESAVNFVQEHELKAPVRSETATDKVVIAKTNRRAPKGSDIDSSD